MRTLLGAGPPEWVPGSGSVGRYLLHLVDVGVEQGLVIIDESGSVELGDIDMQEMSEPLGLNRERVVKELSDLRRMQLVETGRNRVHILDVAALRAYVVKHKR